MVTFSTRWNYCHPVSTSVSRLSTIQILNFEETLNVFYTIFYYSFTPWFFYLFLFLFHTSIFIFIVDYKIKQLGHLSSTYGSLLSKLSASRHLIIFIKFTLKIPILKASSLQNNFA